MRDGYDVVIIGGAVIGSSVAYFLTANPDFDGSVLIIERDSSFAQASTSLSSSSIRNQFSNPINVQISQFGTQFIRDFAEVMEVDGDKPDLGFHEGGYLFLAQTDTQVQILRENHAVQKSLGADVVLWDPGQIKTAFPHLRVDDLQLTSYGQSGEGWFSNTGLMNGFRNKARAQGADYLIDEVVDILRSKDQITGVALKSGRSIACGTLVNASGPRAAQTAAMAGLTIPVEPRKRSIFVFDCATTPEGSATVNRGRLPLMIDPSGTFCRPEGQYFLAGTVPADDPMVDWDDFEPRHEEFDRIWMDLANRSEAFEAVKLVNFWAGHYAFNTLDHNVIAGSHNKVRNFLFANGFSGHGLQQSPAIGRGISEWITYGEFRTLDLSEIGYDRVVRNEPFLEKAVI
ncbi:4-methylaminobutanoate oxidase (formaldehyde-forming) [Roseovarius albus]|uniref:4-methylaminobutanoate oxidase (Formaldehyde-forming) n=1 Tax=Roseovarius albus TaxID=1247867 RepID=A0A1X6Z7V8_9RHOB|nr:FAD-binding oxidoreductase [Roseovarius albus]SLN42934.1 4-methylaminobutanoate oxidase (formaldehyde-forming) [Roseovarius albus]